MYRDAVRQRNLEVRRLPVPDDDPIRTVVPNLAQGSGQVCKFHTQYMHSCIRQMSSCVYAVPSVCMHAHIICMFYSLCIFFPRILLCVMNEHAPFLVQCLKSDVLLYQVVSIKPHSSLFPFSGFCTSGGQPAPVQGPRFAAG